MKIVVLLLSVFILAVSAFGLKTNDPCSDKPYSGTEEPLCRMRGFEYWTYDHDKKDCISYVGYCPEGLNVFGDINECEMQCKFKNIDPCKDESYSGKNHPLGGSVFWTYDNDKKDCFGYRAFNPKSYNLFISSNECKNKCKFKHEEEQWIFPDYN